MLIKKIGVDCRKKNMWGEIKNPLLRRKNQAIHFVDPFGQYHGGNSCLSIIKRLIPKINKRGTRVIIWWIHQENASFCMFLF